MPEENKEAKSTTKPKSGLIILAIILGVIIVVGLIGYLIWRFLIQDSSDEMFNRAMNAISPGTTTSAPSKNTKTGITDKSLIGTWESDCLVPAPENSKWAEKHKYVINADGTATHTRQDWEAIDCTSTQPTGLITDKFNITIPSAGKINSTYTAAENTRMDAAQLSALIGNTFYDIYKVSGNTLEFGWGFRDDLSYGSQKAGMSESDRIDSLNEYIIYHKK